MGLSVKDPATLVTLNSLSPDSYDAAKLWLSLAVLCLTATLFAAKVWCFRGGFGGEGIKESCNTPQKAVGLNLQGS